MFWFPLTMGKTGQGFLLPLTHPLSQHRPQASGLQWQRQSRTYSKPPACESIQSIDAIKSVTFVDSSVNFNKIFPFFLCSSCFYGL